MFFLAQPTEADIDRFLRSQEKMPYAYTEVGATDGTLPVTYVIDRNRIRLGSGRDTFERGVAAVRRWEMFNLGWVSICWPDTPIEVGRTVAVCATHFGFWSLHASRIVYVVDGELENVRRFGFAYGTLPDHAECGEERFSIEWNRADDSVWYDLLAFSRPNQLLSLVAYPVTRYFQKRFAADSKQAMWRAVNGDSRNG